MKVERICKHCGSVFMAFPYKVREGKAHYCGRPCLNAHREFLDYSERFWKKVCRVEEAACWLWIGSLTDQGYGEFLICNKKHRAHRIAYRLACGDIPDGLLVCHRCDNRRCCNPSHLFVGTHHDNTQDMLDKERNSCGPIRYGKDHPGVKLTEDQVRKIRTLRRNKSVTIYSLAAEMNVSPSTISAAQHRRNWAWLDEND